MASQATLSEATVSLCHKWHKSAIFGSFANGTPSSDSAEVMRQSLDLI
jgi:hypothetical protein